MDYNENINDLKQLSWYHSKADRHVAESLLMHNGKEGYYLLRPSANENIFTLSVRAKDSSKHFQITVHTDGVISFGFGKYKDVESLVKHFNSNPLLAGESGVPLMLRCSYPNTVVELSHYEQVRVHAEMKIQDLNDKEEDNGEHDVHPLSMASKEGYLTKQGGRIKTWKHRWCVIQKLEMRYYNKRSDIEPLRIINLKECSSCDVDNTQKQEHCFSLTLPWRTFYFYSTSDYEMKEWIDMIKWKLDSYKKEPKT